MELHRIKLDSDKHIGVSSTLERIADRIKAQYYECVKKSKDNPWSLVTLNVTMEGTTTRQVYYILSDEEGRSVVSIMFGESQEYDAKAHASIGMDLKHALLDMKPCPDCTGGEA